MKHEIIKFYPLQVWYVISINMNHNIGFFHGKNVMIHVIKHDMDPNSNINYSRKIAPI